MIHQSIRKEIRIEERILLEAELVLMHSYPGELSRLVSKLITDEIKRVANPAESNKSLDS